MLVYVLHDGPGYGDTVVGGGTAAQLVEQHQAARRQVVQDVGGFVHLYHEGRLTHGDVVAGAYTGKYLVHQPDVRTLGRHEAAYLRHEGDERRLAEEGRLTGHVGTGDDDNLLRLAVEHDVVGNIFFANGQLLFNDRMASLMDIEHIVVSYHRTYVVVLTRHVGKGQEAVQPGNLVGIGLYGRNELTDALHQLGIELCLQHQYLVLGSQYFFFVFLQFLRDVTLGVSQRLLAYPLLGHLVLVGIAHLDVIAEDVVVANLQAGDAGQVTFALLNLQQVVLARVGNLAQLIEFGTDATLNDTALVDQQRRVVVDFLLDAVAQQLAEVEQLANVVQTGIVGLGTGLLDGFDGPQGYLERHHLAGRHTTYGSLGDDALQVAYLV